MEDNHQTPFLNSKTTNRNSCQEEIQGVHSCRCDFCGYLGQYRCLGGPATVKGCNKFYCSEHGAPDLSNLCYKCSQNNVKRKNLVIILVSALFFVLYKWF